MRWVCCIAGSSTPSADASTNSPVAYADPAPVVADLHAIPKAVLARYTVTAASLVEAYL
ncbi:hypothetical protein [Mycobacterium lepromatosis]|uniref:hypothetical protein n=1 Tax=Mycobacterium lepromatosis TaxID=480418 RepID=UPI000AC04FEC|nr:hypothetical protein [Mycobacterium lepromatosis]